MAGAKRVARALSGGPPPLAGKMEGVPKPPPPPPVPPRAGQQGGGLIVSPRGMTPTPQEVIIAQMGPTLNTHRGIPIPPDDIFPDSYDQGSRIGTTAHVQNGGIPPYPQGNRIPGPPPPPPWAVPPYPQGGRIPGTAGKITGPTQADVDAQAAQMRFFEQEALKKQRAAQTEEANQQWIDEYTMNEDLNRRIQIDMEREAAEAAAGRASRVPDFSSPDDGAAQKPGFFKKHPYVTGIGGIGLLGGGLNWGAHSLYDKIRANPEAEYEGGQAPPNEPVPTQDEITARRQEILNRIRGNQ